MEILIALIVAAIGLLAVLKLFSGGPPPATQRPAHSTSEPKKAKSQSPGPATSQQKKETKAERKAREEEEALIERELRGQQGKGLTKEKYHVMTLDEKRAQVHGGGGLQQGSAQQTEFSEREKLIEKEKGFRVVETKKKEEKKPVVVDTVSHGEELDRKLNGFFRNSDRKGKKKEGGFGGSPKESPESGGGGVHIYENKDTFHNASQRSWS